jgi:hypothetical protein
MMEKTEARRVGQRGVDPMGRGGEGRSWEVARCHLRSDLGREFGVHRGGKGPREGGKLTEGKASSGRDAEDGVRGEDLVPGVPVARCPVSSPRSSRLVSRLAGTGLADLT